MNKLKNNIAVCFGEILFDLFPSGKKPGGAPMNVAIHLQNLGIPTAMISRVGNDHLGEEIVTFLKDKDVNTDLIQIDKSKNTGTVNVTLDERKNATYEIVENVSWDNIDSIFIESMIQPQYIIHGSLACRSEKSKNSLLKLLDYSNSKIVFDLNLRKPYYDQLLIEKLLDRANIIKMNEDEFELLKRWLKIKEPSLEEEFAKLKSLYENLEIAIVTMGKNGAMAWQDYRQISVPGITIRVEDTVGSGDAFLGAFISQIAKGETLEKALVFASAAGAFVATQPGANPAYEISDIYDILKKEDIDYLEA